MRLIQVLHGWPPEKMGGTGLYVQALSRSLLSLGHEVLVVTPGRSLRPQLKFIEDGGIRGCQLLQPPALSWTAAWRRSTGLTLWRSLLEKERPDRVHIHHLSGMPLGLVSATADAQIPVTLTLHDYWLPCHRGQLVDRSLDLCSGPTPAGCARCATGRTQPRSRDQSRATHRGQAAADAIRAADWLLSPSEDLAQRMGEMGFPVPDICPLPLVSPATPPAPQEDGPTRFLFASSVIPTKGPQQLLQAFEMLPPGPTLTIAGHAPSFDGHPDFAEQLKTAAARNPNIQWLGPIPTVDVPALMSRHDVLVLPSIWPENSPLVVREATAAGLRVVASKHGGAAELAPSAALVPPGDVSALAKALAAEVARGRTRNAPQIWQTPQEHAEWLLKHHPGEDEPHMRD